MFSVLRSTRALASRSPVCRAPLARMAPLAPAARAGLHASARARAAADPFNDPQIVEMRAKIQSHEGTKAAIMRLGELMQAKGESAHAQPAARSREPAARAQTPAWRSWLRGREGGNR